MNTNADRRIARDTQRALVQEQGTRDCVRGTARTCNPHIHGVFADYGLALAWWAGWDDAHRNRVQRQADADATARRAEIREAAKGIVLDAFDRLDASVSNALACINMRGNDTRSRNPLDYVAHAIREARQNIEADL